MTDVVPIQTDERGDEVHPSFGLIGASRVSYGPPGQTLFDSDIRHNHTVRIRIHEATRKRDLNHDWIHGRKEYIEVELSEAQWASFVSSMNVGDGVPCTLRAISCQSVPSAPHEPRLAQSMQETRDAAHDAFDAIQEALATYDAMDSKTPAAQRREAFARLRATINNAVPNVDYAGKTLVEHTENVVTKARADIEAYVVAKARQLNVDVSELIASEALAIGERSES